MNKIEKETVTLYKFYVDVSDMNYLDSYALASELAILEEVEEINYHNPMVVVSNSDIEDKIETLYEKCKRKARRDT